MDMYVYDEYVFVNLQKYRALNGSKKFCFALKSHLRTEVV